MLFVLLKDCLFLAPMEKIVLDLKDLIFNMKNIALIIVFLFIKSVGNGQPINRSSTADSVKTKSLSC